MIDMKRLNVIVSDAAHKAVKDYQEAHNIGTRDEAIERMILDCARKVKK